MRIPNQIDRDSLYRRRGRVGGPNDSWRRLIRLGIAMALVLVVMRQAARPGVYAVFFPEPVVQVSGNLSQSNLAQSNVSQSNTRVSRARDETDLGGKVPSRMEQDSLIAQVKDGTVWRAADQPALCATLALHRSNALADLTPPDEPILETGVLPLLQQPDVYLGRTVKATGKLVRITSVKADANDWGVNRYWDCWLQPTDGSQRPWLVIVPNLPVGIRELVPPSKDEKGGNVSIDVTGRLPTIVVVGEFIKRLSYPSAQGAELTPVVVGHIESIQSNGNVVVGAAIQAATNASGEQPAGAESKSLSLSMIVAIASIIGLSLGGFVMWRTSVAHRRLRSKRIHRDVTLPIWIGLAFAVWPGSKIVAQESTPTRLIASQTGQSLIDLLSGFDAARLIELETGVADKLDSPKSREELAKLVFRMNRLSSETLQQRMTPPDSGSPESASSQPGDAISVDGEIQSMQSLVVPSELAGYLNLKRILLVHLTFDSGRDITLVIPPLPTKAIVGDRLSGVAVQLNSDGAFAVGGAMRWRPSQPDSLGWEVLSALNVDISRLPEIASLGRRPLVDGDADVFFAMIGAAQTAGQLATSEELLGPTAAAMRAAAVEVTAANLLQAPEQWIGQWISMDVQTVRWTKVAVQSSARREEVGADHYFQIDAIGDLGNVRLEIATGDGGTVSMENRCPITLVAKQLPAFLANEQALSQSNSIPVRVEGFFYRLWSYESDFMASHGGKQFAPLMIAGRWTDRSPTSADPIGVRWIGFAAAVGVITAIVGAVVFAWINRRGDQAARQLRP